MSERKIIRKVKIEIFEDRRNIETHESGLYETDLKGNPSTKEGQEHLRSAFKGNKAELVTVKINKRRINKVIVTRDEYRKIARKRFK